VVQDARLTLVPAGELTPERRRRLLETAAREFAANGYEHASLNAIIRDCDMRKSSFYHYVGSKAALFDVVVQEAMNELARVLNIPAPRELAGPHYWDAVIRLVTEVLAVAARGDWYADVGRLFYLPDAPVQNSPTMREVLQSIGEWLSQALASGRACGAVRDDLPLSLQMALVSDVLRCLDGWSLQHLHEYPKHAQADITRLQIDILRRLLAP
jgi:AcrR family transcriptional regulator